MITSARSATPRATAGTWTGVGKRLPSLEICQNWLFALRLRSEEHTSELQSLAYLVCRLLLEKKKKQRTTPSSRPSGRPATSCRGRAERIDLLSRAACA